MRSNRVLRCFVPSVDAVPRKLGMVLALLLAVLGLFLTASHATSPQASMVMVAEPMDETFPITPVEGDQRMPALVYNPTDNEYLVAYLDSVDLAVMRLLTDATPIGSPFIIAEGVCSHECDIDVTFNNQAEEYMVTWMQWTEGFDYSIFGQRISSADGTVGDRIDVSVRPARQRAPAVTACGGAYLVVWDEDVDPDPAVWSFFVFGQMITRTGQLVGVPGRMSTDQGRQQVDPDIVCGSQPPEYLVAWKDARNYAQGSGFNDDIYGQRVSLTGGAVLTHDIPISTQFSEPPGGNKQNIPDVAYNSRNHHYLVVWQDLRNDPVAGTEPEHHDIYAQRLLADGTITGLNFPITVVDANQQYPAVAYSRQANEYLVVWEDHRGADVDIFAQRVSRSGGLLGEEITVCNAEGDQLAPVVAYNDATGEYLIVWEDHRNQSTRGIDLYGRLYEPPYLRFLPLVDKVYPVPLPSDAEDRARAWLDQQTNHFRSADAIPGFDRGSCSARVVRYKGEQTICQPAIPGDALVSFDYCSYGTPDQKAYLGRHGRAFLYDQALGAIAWLMDGEQEKARRLLDFLSSYQNCNLDVPGAANGSFGFSFNTVGCPAYSPDNRDSFYDLDYLRNGAIAWAGYAFVFHQSLTGDARYLDNARLTAEYLLTQQVTGSGDPRFGLLRGGHGAYNPEFIPGQVEWVSTEHNVDAYFFLRELGALTGDPRYSTASNQIRDGLLTKLWSEDKGRLDRGLEQNGQPDGVDALDAASWGAIFLLAAGEEEKAVRSLAYAEQMYRNQVDGIWGYKPHTGTVDNINWDIESAVWSEGSLGMAMAYAKMGDGASLNQARLILNQMANLQERDPAGGLFYMLNLGNELDGFPRVPSVGGTAWLFMTLRALEDSTVRDTFWGTIP